MSRTKLAWAVSGLLAAALLATAAIGLYWNFRSSDEGREVAQFLTDRNVALGYLESGQPERSLPAFHALAEAFPQQALGRRNEVVALLLMIENAPPADRPPLIARASHALGPLRELEPNSADSFSVAARVRGAEKNFGAAYSLLIQAAELEPENPAIWFEAYLAAKQASPALEDEAIAALERASRFAPNNLAVWLELLQEYVDAKSPSTGDALQQAQTKFQPLEDSVQKFVRVSLQQLFTSAREAVAADDWSAVRRNVRLVVNATRAEDAVQSDRLNVDRNPLEFVLVDFDDAFYERWPVKVTSAGPAIEVTFELDPLLTFPDAPLRDIAAADFYLDGSKELAILAGQTLNVYEHGAGGQQESELHIPLTGSYQGILVADLDSDFDAQNPAVNAADIDIVLYGESGVLVLVNESGAEGLRFETATESPIDQRGVTTATLGDFDHDGDLDIFAASADRTTVWSNVDGRNFRPWEDGGIFGLPGGTIPRAVASDWDRDTDLDLVLAAADGTQLGWLENLRHRRMRWHAFEKGIAVPPTRFEVGEMDANGSWDLLYPSEEGIQLTLTRLPRSHRVVPLKNLAVSSAPARILQVFDYDNDGLEDLLIIEDGRMRLLRALGAGSYDPVSKVLPELPESVTSAESLDWDTDGDLDLLLQLDQQVVLLRNIGGNTNNWIDVTLLAAQTGPGGHDASGRVNAAGIGSLLELRHEGHYQAKTVRSEVTHFGLGARPGADVIRVIWTNGIPQNILRPQSNQLVTERQTLKGSCPYLFAWSGNGYEFVTDLLWAAPLGLQTPAGQIAPDRPWEHLRIPGEAVQEVDGEYRLQITEELWEAAYFDQVEFLAIDHPADVQVFTNEKVGPAHIASHKLYAVKNPIPLLAAFDSEGRDIRGLLSEQDEQYVKAFDRKIMQGLTEPHYVELDFGRHPPAEKVVLLLTGWIYPTDTSLNVQLAENPNSLPPRPPYLLLQDDQGRWQEADSFIGFPGGKTKTIAVDLSHHPFDGKYRMRIASSAEIYWDAALLATGDASVDLKEQPLELRKAELYHRGFSERVPAQHHGPERYNFYEVEQEPAWPPMLGRFTRYGDVTWLLQAWDDQMVVMGSGDALELRFAAPERVPPGWRRTFVLHNVGWDKDADLNTVYGQSSEPFPFRAMGSYPSDVETTRPSTASHERYLDDYQTRRQGDRFWRSVRSAVD